MKETGSAGKQKQYRGQGLVEFALILPILLLLVLGTLDIGRAFSMKVALENAAREGAYYLVYNTTDGKANSFNLTKTTVQAEAQESGVEIPMADVTVVCKVGTTINNACPSGSTVIVTVHQTLPLVLDLIFGGPLDLANDAKMMIP